MSKTHVILCGGNVAGPKNALRLELGKGRGKMSLDVDALTEKTMQRLPAALHDLLEIATYVYVADQAISRGGTKEFEYGKKWVRHIQLRIPVREYDLWSAPEINELLSEALSFVSGDIYEFRFSRQSTDDFPAFLNFRANAEPRFKHDEVVLFSGGLDSFTGAVDEVVGHNKCPVLVSHQSNRKMTKLQRILHEYIVGLRSSGLKPLHVPVTVNKDKRLTRDTCQRSRSFLYASLGTVIARMFGLNRVKFYENGIVTCKLPLDGQTLQARSTRVTHPKFLRLLSTVISEVTNSDFQVENPYFLKTKTEVCMRLKELHHAPYMRKTRSCARSVYRKPRNHCGTCSQCIDRRFATLASECQEYDPDFFYALNIFTDKLDNAYNRAMAARFVGLATKIERMTIDGFVQYFSSHIHEIANYMEGQDREEKFKELFALHQRHAAKVNQVIEAKCKESMSDLRKGILPDTCLVSMVASREHLNTGNVLRANGDKLTPKTKKNGTKAEQPESRFKPWENPVDVRLVIDKQRVKFYHEDKIEDLRLKNYTQTHKLLFFLTSGSMQPHEIKDKISPDSQVTAGKIVEYANETYTAHEN